jgi:truncated hemoglobin YjbI
MKYNTITKENINEMVISFYATILNNTDNPVSKVFISRLGDDLNSPMWKKHTDLLTEFWSMIAQKDTTYEGNPMMAHFNMGLTADMFPMWIEMFYKTIDKFYIEPTGDIFKQRANNIAQNFMRNLGLS